MAEMRKVNNGSGYARGLGIVRRKSAPIVAHRNPRYMDWLMTDDTSKPSWQPSSTLRQARSRDSEPWQEEGKREHGLTQHTCVPVDTLAGANPGTYLESCPRNQ